MCTTLAQVMKVTPVMSSTAKTSRRQLNVPAVVSRAMISMERLGKRCITFLLLSG